MDSTQKAKLDILSQVDFGHRVAEQETDELATYFVKTDQWSQLVRGNVDIVYGAKGSGKSALYSRLLHTPAEILGDNVIVVPVERPSGKPAFQEIADGPAPEESELLAIWKLYFLSIIADVLRDWGVQTEEARRVYAALEEAGLLQPRKSLGQVLARVRGYVKRLSGLHATVELDPGTGLPTGLTTKITMAEPDDGLRAQGCVSVDELLADADAALQDVDFTLWLVLDRLDVAFAESARLEQRALRALFRTYLDIQGLKRISLKLFLRSDIWHRITREGFREASHITRSLTIAWDRQSLLQLIVRRLLKNPPVRAHLGLPEESVDVTAAEVEDLVARVLPGDLDLGATMDPVEWTLHAVQDGTRQVAPRELIHLLSAACDEQIRRLETGHSLPRGDELLDAASMELALGKVSEVRLTQTLYAEYPALRQSISKLEGEASQLSLQSLSMAWGTTTTAAENRAEELLEIGFFERRRSKRHPNYVIPLLYRPALRIREGSSDVFLMFGREVIDAVADFLVQRLNGSNQRLRIARRHSGAGTELVVIEFTDPKYRRRMSLWLFAAESGSSLSLRDTEGTFGESSNGIGAALFSGSGGELEYDEYQERLGGTQFRWMQNFRSQRAGARLFVSYSQLSGRPVAHAAEAFVARLVKPLRDAEMIARPLSGWKSLEGPVDGGPPPPA